jgi:hypothetical protein
MKKVWIVNYRYDLQSELHVFDNEPAAMKNAFDIIKEEVDGIINADSKTLNRPRWEPLINAIANNNHSQTIYEWTQLGDNEVTVECCEVRTN